jgi:hypothetical protein
MRKAKMKMDWYKENYPTGKLYIYNRRQGKFSGFHGNDIPFANGRPYLFVRWSTPVNPITQERMDFDNAVFFVDGSETLIDRGMMRDFELIE